MKKLIIIGVRGRGKVFADIACLNRCEDVVCQPRLIALRNSLKNSKRKKLVK